MARKIGWRGSNCPKVLIVGECPSASDVKFGKAFTGVEEILLKEWLDKVGVRADEVRVGHLLDERPLGGDPMRHVAAKKSEMTPDHDLVDGRWVDSALRRGREALRAMIDHYEPNVVVAAGNLALWALTGNWGIQSWRGSLLVNILAAHPAKVIPTISPFKVNISYEWYSIVEKDFGRVAKERHGLEMPVRREDFLIRPTFEDTIKTLNWLLDKASESAGLDLACDIETRAGHIACVGLGWSETSAICIPFMDVEIREGYWSAEEELEIQNLLLDLLTHPNCRVIGQNFQYDLQYFWKHLMYEPNLQWDTMIVHHSLFPSGRAIETAGDAGKKATGRDVLKKSLGFLSSIYCKDHWYWKEDREGWETEDEYWAYNCRDCVRTWEIAKAQKRMIYKRGHKQAFVSAFQQDLFWPVWEIMKRGLPVDKVKRAEYKKSLQDAIKEREEWFVEVLGHPLNIGSPAQMKTLFYTDLGQKPVTKRGLPGKPATITCDDAAMATIVEREPLLRPLVSRIQEIRSLGVFLNTFIEAAVDDDGQMRSSLNIPGTKTYRFSSNKTAFEGGCNFQNIPANQKKKDADQLTMPDVRKMFIPPKGMTIFDSDLDSADLRIVTEEGDVEEMRAMFREGKKPYVEIAKEYYRDPTIDKNHWAYGIFKSLCHGTNYLGASAGLASRCGLLVAEVERIQAWYFGKFPGIRKWQETTKQQVMGRRYIENAFGYRFPFLGRITEDSFREAVAWIPQSSVAIIINHILKNLTRNLPQVYLINQVHDSLVGYFPTAQREVLLPQITAQAQIVVPYPSKLIIPVGFKTSDISWGDCK